MDAKDFIRIHAEECKNHQACRECPFVCGCCLFRKIGKRMTQAEIEKSVAIAEKLDHKKTYADDFFEKFPDAPTESNGKPIPCRDTIYRRRPKLCGGESCLSCWNETFPEEKK